MQQHILKAAESAPAATYGGGAATAAFWGLHANEICMAVSTLVAVAGFLLQLYLAVYRIRRLERRD